jgi:hypothetical protein
MSGGEVALTAGFIASSVENPFLEDAGHTAHYHETVPGATGGEHDISLDLSAEEREILQQVLETEFSDLRMEIAGTDSFDYRERLKRRKEVLRKVLDAVQA